jgi:hypothetical protein
MKVILMGGSGMIGRALSAELTGHGHEVVILSRRLKSGKLKTSRLPGGSSLKAWDGKTADGWLDVVEEAGALVNLAGENIGAGLWTPERKRRILQSRLDAGIAVIDALRQAKNKPGVILQASAVGIYGAHSAESVLTEEAETGQDYLSGVARQWEDATRLAEEWVSRRIVARIGVVLDRSEGILPRFMLPFRFFVGGPMGSGRQIISWIHIHDLVRGMRFLLENEDAKGIYNLTAPGAVSNLVFGRALAEQMERPFWMPAPEFALRLVLGEMSTLLLDGQRVIPARLEKAGFRFLFPDVGIALTHLLHGGAQEFSTN